MALKAKESVKRVTGSALGLCGRPRSQGRNTYKPNLSTQRLKCCAAYLFVAEQGAAARVNIPDEFPPASDTVWRAAPVLFDPEIVINMGQCDGTA